MIYSQPIIVTRFAPGAGDDSGLFEGVAGGWSQDRHGDVVERGAYGESIAALHAGQRRIPFLLNHDPSKQLGGIKGATESDDGLLVSGQIVRGTPEADRVHALAKADQMSLSVGFMPIAGAMEKMPGGGTRYKRVDLVEVSAVATPSSREGRVLRIKEFGEMAPAELESLLREGELPPMPRRLAAKLTRAWLAALDDDEPDPADEAALYAALAGATQVFKRGK